MPWEFSILIWRFEYYWCLSQKKWIFNESWWFLSLKDVLKPTSKSSLLTVMIIFIDQRLILLCTISVFIHCVKVDLFFYFPDAMMMSAPDSMKVWRKWRLSSNKRTLHKTERGAQRLRDRHRDHMSVGQKCCFKKYI